MGWKYVSALQKYLRQQLFKTNTVSKYQLKPYGNTMLNWRRFDVDITSICQRPNLDKFPSHFHVLFRCNFADRKIHVASKYFFRCNFAGRKIHVVSTYFFRRNFSGFSSIFFNVISIVKNSTLFPRAFSGVILMVEKSTLFARTFSNKILMGKNLASVLIKLQANAFLEDIFLCKWL